MVLTSNLEQMICTFDSCAEKAISGFCAHKDGEKDIYMPSCLQHEPETRREIEKRYAPLGYSISIFDIPEGNK